MIKVSLYKLTDGTFEELGQAETNEQAWRDIIEPHPIYRQYKKPYFRYWYNEGKQYCDFGSWSYYIILEET